MPHGTTKLAFKMAKYHKINLIYMPTYLDATCQHPKKPKFDDLDLIN